MLKKYEWKYVSKKELFIEPIKAMKHIVFETAVVYDTRSFYDFKEIHLEGSFHMDRTEIRDRILNHDLKDKIILIGDNPRSNSYLVTWAKSKGYKNIRLFNHDIKKFIEERKHYNDSI